MSAQVSANDDGTFADDEAALLEHREPVADHRPEQDDEHRQQYEERPEQQHLEHGPRDVDALAASRSAPRPCRG